MKDILRDRKGVSPLFVAMYLGVLILLLSSTLLGILQTSGSAISSRSNVEFDKNQERLLMLPGSLNITTEGLGFLRVNNTGAITIRLRSIYVNNVFIDDPSRHQNTYINPQDSVLLDLRPFNITFTNEVLNGTMTMTTERGTHVTESVKNLLFGPGSTPGSELVYGPIRLIWDMFHWSNTTALNKWYDGWRVSTSDGKVLTWRIFIQNIDKTRDISLTEFSCITLISPDVGARLPWYINTDRSITYLKPGEYALVYYSWPAPLDRTHTQGIFQKGDMTCPTFLVFVGEYVELGKPNQKMGETVPFEAVFVMK